MTLSLDPENSVITDPQIREIADKKQQYIAARNAMNIAARPSSSSDPSDNVFKCGPPDGVLITEWIPAIQCWIKNTLPPRIEGGVCTSAQLIKEGDETQY